MIQNGLWFNFFICWRKVYYLDCREADESRLREVCESFLGPPTGMVDATPSDPKNPAWDPCVLVSPFLSL